MRRKTGQILNGVLLGSGFIHITGLLKNWEYDFYVGLTMIVVSGLWFTVDFLKNNKSFSTKNYLIVEKQQLKWWRMKEIVGIATMIFLLIYNSGQIDSILITLILYFSLLVLLDHKRTLELTDKYISDDGVRINFDSMTYLDFKQNQIVIKLTDEIIGEKRISLETIDTEDKELIKKRLMDATAVNNVFVRG
jgi:hypothetical protein